MKYILILISILFFSGCIDEKKSAQEKQQTKHVKINSLDSLKEFIEDGQKNGYFPKKLYVQSFSAKNKLQEIDLNFRTIIEWNSNSKCPSHEDEIILALDNKNHSIVCNAGDTVVLLGDGNDWVKDATGNDIFYPGEGNDTIKTSYGSDIFIFEKNWGHDTIKFSSKSVNKDTVSGYDGSYPWEYSSFIIFGKEISRSDIRWDDKSLINTKTGDTIALNTKNVNILFANEKKSNQNIQNFIPKQYKAEKIDLEKITAESVLVKDDFAYFSKGDDGLYIVNIKNLSNTTIVSKVTLPGRAMSVQIEDDVAYIAQGDYGLEGKKGWVSIVDIKDPTQPKILKTLNFGNNIFSVAIKDKKLYIPDTHFFNKNERNLHIYDLSTPQNPKLLSQTKLQYFSKFIIYLNDVIYLSSFQNGTTVFDVTDPKHPKKTMLYKKIKKSDWSIKTNNHQIIINHSDNVFSVVKPSDDKKLISICDIYPTDQDMIAGLAGIDTIAIRGNIVFRAEGKMGVSITNIDECKVMKVIPFEEYWISSIYIVHNTLVAYNVTDKTSRVYNLDSLFPEYKVKPESRSTAPIKEKEIVADDGYSSLSESQLQTLLYEAAAANDANTTQALCQAGANPNEYGHEKHTPLQISARLGNIDALQVLLDNGGKPDRRSMMVAALREQFLAMKLLEKYGGNLASTDSDGCTTLHYIAQDGTLEMVKYLTEKGVPINATCRGGETALKWADYGENREIIDYLKSIGAK